MIIFIIIMFFCFKCIGVVRIKVNDLDIYVFVNNIGICFVINEILY